jgi:hypothetical protein
MRNRPSRARTPRQQPLDHLRPRERPTGTQPEATSPATNVEDDAARGKSTRSGAEVATRRHLEGSEQDPA